MVKHSSFREFTESKGKKNYCIVWTTLVLCRKKLLFTEFKGMLDATRVFLLFLHFSKNFKERKRVRDEMWDTEIEMQDTDN